MCENAIDVLASCSLWCSLKMSNWCAYFREVCKEQVIIPPLVSVVSIDPARQVGCGTDRNNEANQFSSRRIDQHSFNNGRFPSTTRCCHSLLATRCRSVVNRLDNAAMYRAELLSKLLWHVGSQESLGICKALLTAFRIDTLWDINPC